jgi:glycosyltransferase involved in cell wall biosynthesis
MNILFVQTNAYSDYASGVPRVTYNLGKHFTQQGLQVAYFSFANKDHIDAEHGTLYHAKEAGGVNNKVNFNELKKCILEFKPDRVINQMPYEFKLRNTLAEFGAVYNFKLIGCIHNSLFAFKSNVKDIMRRKLPKPFNQIMATNFMSKIPLLYHRIKQKIVLRSVIKLHDITLLYTAANYKELTYFLKSKDFDESKIEYMLNPVIAVKQKMPKKEKIILHIGRMNIPQKRSDLLLDFWEKTYKELPDWQFKVVGNGPYYETIVADLKKRKLPRIELLGYQKPESYYKKASVFMMPSAYEGLPHTIIESQSYGCPVIAFNSYGALEYIVDNEKNALLAKPFNTSEMAKKCIDLINSNIDLAKMQQSALKNAERFTIQKIGKKWMELFEKMT